MPKEYFTTANTGNLADLAPGSKIHFIGVCGTAMGQLAAALSAKGYRVTGSDKEFYEPLGSFLKGFPVELQRGFSADNVPRDADLVVIGNVVSYGHPEVAVVESQGLPYSLFPKLLAETVIADRTSIVVCGTHGKSTTSALIASGLQGLGADPAYFVGGVMPGLPTSLHAGTGGISVVEGDEYDSAFFAKIPKFTFYRPDICVINAVEFDHADIYSDLQAVIDVFNKLVHSLHAKALLLCSLDGPNLADLVQDWRKSARCSIVTFGLSAAADCRIVDRQQHGKDQQVNVESKALGSFSYTVPLIGEYNARNSLAAVLAMTAAGFNRDLACSELVSFEAPRRRQELRFQTAQLTLIEDFAHHPTAVRLTLEAIREAYPDKRIWAVFEPRSNTCRRKVFFEEYLQAFAGVSQALLCEVAARANDTSENLLEVPVLAAAMNAAGITTQVLPNAGSISEHIRAHCAEIDVIVVMSNGSFGSLVDLMISWLSA